MKKVFIGGLPKSVTDEKLRDTFCKYGDIVDYVVMKDPYSRESRGFGFVEFSSEQPVNEIIKGRPHSIDGREIEVRRAMPKDNTHNTIHERTRRIFIGGLNYDITEDVLLKYYNEKFAEYGHVEAVEIKRDHETNQSRGFGFITFDTEDTADVALILESKPTQFGRNCEIKKSEPRRVIERASQRNGSNRHYGRNGPSPPRRRNNYDDYYHSPIPSSRDYYRNQRMTRYDREPYPLPPSDFRMRYEHSSMSQRDRHYPENGNYYDSGYSRQYYDTQVPIEPRSYNSPNIPNEYSRPASARLMTNSGTSRVASSYPTRTSGPSSTSSRQYSSGYKFNDSKPY